MPFELLKNKLMTRLDTMGIRITRTYEEVLCYFIPFLPITFQWDRISIFPCYRSLPIVMCRNGLIFQLAVPYRTLSKRTLPLVLLLAWSIQPLVINQYHGANLTLTNDAWITESCNNTTLSQQATQLFDPCLRLHNMHLLLQIFWNSTMLKTC